MSARRYVLVYQDGTRQHITRENRDALLCANRIKQIGVRQYKSNFPISRIKTSHFDPVHVSNLRCKARCHAELRASRMAQAKGFHTFEQWIARVEFYGWRCRYCGIALNHSTLTKDHQIAISKGGSDWASNLVPACKSCNSWKHDRLVRVFGA